MEVSCPEAVTGFERFLSSHGFVCERKEVVSEFGDVALRAFRAHLCVEVAVDRSKWYVSVSDQSISNTKYDPAILRDFLGGAGEGEDVLSLDTQIEFTRNSFSEIVNLFTSENRESIHQQLKSMQMNRLKRRHPRLFKEGP